MAHGTVKWFDPVKGFGFIVPNEGENNVFIHISAVKAAGLNTLIEGQKIQYELESRNGKTCAVQLSF